MCPSQLNRNLSNCEGARLFFFRATSQLLKLRFNCNGRMHTHFICIPAVHIISFNTFNTVCVVIPASGTQIFPNIAQVLPQVIIFWRLEVHRIHGRQCNFVIFAPKYSFIVKKANGWVWSDRLRNEKGWARGWRVGDTAWNLPMRCEFSFPFYICKFLLNQVILNC